MLRTENRDYFFEYKGEMYNGKACGKGVATMLGDSGCKYDCTWYNDKLHGLCK